MKKTITFMLLLLFALIGLNSNAAIYIVGDAPFGEWNPAAGVEMISQGDGTYTYSTTINGTVYFVFADGLDSDWDTFNSNYRYGPANGDQTITPGTWFPTQKAGDHGSYRFTGSGETYEFFFDENRHQFKIDGYVDPLPPFTTYTVAGSDPAIFGEAWNPQLTDNDMTLDNADGLYKLVKNEVAIPAGYSLEYKVVANHSWENNWGKTPGGDNQNYYFNEGGTYNLIFLFDPAAETVSMGAVLIEGGTVVDDYYIVAGTENLFGSYWNPTDKNNLMTKGEDGIFTWTKNGYEATAGTEVMFKVVANGNWNTCWPPSDENGDNNWWYKFNADGTYNVVITFNPNNKEINCTVLLVDEPEIDPLTGNFFILGNINGNDWNPSTGIEMATTDNNVYNLNNAYLNDSGNGYAYFSFTSKLGEHDSDWSFESYRRGATEDGYLIEDGHNALLAPWGSTNAFKALPGTYDIEVNLSNNYVKITSKDVPYPGTDDVYIIGNVNNYDWRTNVGVKMTYNESSKVYTAAITTQTDGSLQKSYFGFTKKLIDDEDGGAWDLIEPFRFGPVSDGTFMMTEELLGMDLPLATDGSHESIAIDAGSWIVTVDLINNLFCINKITIPEPILGDLNGDGSVNISDVNALINAILQDLHDSKYDLNGDGSINISDVTLLIDWILKDAA